MLIALHTETDDRGFHIKITLQCLGQANTFAHIMHVDSKELFDTITTLHESREYRFRQTVQKIRDSFESNTIDALRWIQAKDYIADALTKHNLSIHKRFNRIAVTEALLLPDHRSFS